MFCVLLAAACSSESSGSGNTGGTGGGGTGGSGGGSDVSCPAWKPSGSGSASKRELDPAQRSGLLTHASVLAAHSHPAHIQRGELVRERVLCQPLPPPPDDVPAAPQPVPGQSTRERFDQIVAAEIGKDTLLQSLELGVRVDYDGTPGRPNYRMCYAGSNEPIRLQKSLVACEPTPPTFSGKHGSTVSLRDRPLPRTGHGRGPGLGRRRQVRHRARAGAVLSAIRS